MLVVATDCQKAIYLRSKQFKSFYNLLVTQSISATLKFMRVVAQLVERVIHGVRRDVYTSLPRRVLFVVTTVG